MNALHKTVLITAASVFFLAGNAWAAKDCARKEQILERKIAIAKSRGNNPYRIANLERALANVRLYCTDQSQRGKAEMNLLDKREEVLEREADLEEARAKGDAEKIAKRERKLREARREAAAAERELKALQP